MSEFDIQYRPQTVVKGQVIADFIAEFTHDKDKRAEESSQWTVHTDESSNREVVECMIHLDFPTTNNEAKYEALVTGLDLARAAGATSVVIYYDSQVITNQINGDYECKGKSMKRYLDQVKRRVDDLQAKIIQIPR